MLVCGWRRSSSRKFTSYFITVGAKGLYVLFIQLVVDRFKRILVLISHSQDFLNGVCTNIIHLHQRKLKYYTVRKALC